MRISEIKTTAGRVSRAFMQVGAAGRVSRVCRAGAIKNPEMVPVPSRW